MLMLWMPMTKVSVDSYFLTWRLTLFLTDRLKVKMGSKWSSLIVLLLLCI